MKRFFLILIMLLLTSPVFAFHQDAYLPAVQETNTGFSGVLILLEADVKRGTGHVFLDTSPLTQVDTQGSARMAKKVVGDILDLDMDEYDMFFTIRGESPVVGGASAGATMTAVSLAEILNVSVNISVVATGTINPDGTVGRVGGIFEKAQAVSKLNNSLFLIPKGNRFVTKNTFAEDNTATTVKIDIIDYAQKNWGMEVREVSNVKEIFEEMTGYEFKKRPKKQFKENVKFKETLKEISNNKLKEAENKLEEIKNSKDTISMTYSGIQEVENLIKQQEDLIQKSKEFINRERYYAAVSKLFAFSIYNEYGLTLINYFQSGNSMAFVKEKLENINEKIEKTKVRIENITESKIEILLTAKERLTESESWLDDGWKAYYNEDFIGALYAASYAEKRLDTVDTWLKIGKSFEKDKGFDFGSLKNMASEKLEEASSSIVYANTIGLSITRAEELFETAQENFKKQDYESAIFNAIDAKVRSDMLMELRGVSNIEGEVEKYKERAKKSLTRSQEKNITPILGLAYFEYALTFENSTEKILYFKFSESFSNFARDLKYEDVEKERIEKDNFVRPEQKIVPADYRYTIIVTILGVFAGFLIGFYFKK